MKIQNEAWETFVSVVGHDCSRDPQTLQSIDIVLGYPVEVECKSLLLKIPYASGTGSRNPACKQELNWNPPLCVLVFMVPEGIMQVCKEGKQSSVLSSYTYERPQ